MTTCQDVQVCRDGNKCIFLNRRKQGRKQHVRNFLHGRQEFFHPIHVYACMYMCIHICAIGTTPRINLVFTLPSSLKCAIFSKMYYAGCRVFRVHKQSCFTCDVSTWSALQLTELGPDAFGCYKRQQFSLQLCRRVHLDTVNCRY